MVGADEKRWRNAQAERLRRLEIDGKLELVGCSFGMSLGLGALQDLIDEISGAATAESSVRVV